MDDTLKITERSLYGPIINLLKEIASKYNISIGAVQEVETGKRYPDILTYLDGYKVLIQVKINHVSKIIDDIIESYPIARRQNAELIGLLFPQEVREINVRELDTVTPKMLARRSLVLTQWLTEDMENKYLYDVLDDILRKFSEFKKTLIPTVDYLTIAKVARETIKDLSSVLRKYIGVKEYFNMAQAIVGRFDFYRALLEDFVEEEEVMKTYLADIMAYLVTIQLLYIHIVSKKKLKLSVLPIIENPLAPSQNLISKLIQNLHNISNRIENYDIISSTIFVLEILNKISETEQTVNQILAKYIFIINSLRPEHVKEELFGRIYQEGLPPETRKNLGAFFTNPVAARLLSRLAICKYDDKVLDPACGSGTLLAEAYQAKIKRTKEQQINVSTDILHRLYIEKHIVGIDIMQFAKELSSIHLKLQNPIVDVKPMIFFGDGIRKMWFAKKIDEVDPEFIRMEDFIQTAQREYESLILPEKGFDVVIMNPPFTRRERIPDLERSNLERMFANIVRGKTGYSAYFFAAADRVVKESGRIAAVTPEEFFAGAAAECVRRYLFLGEEYDATTKKYKKKLDRKYRLRYVMRSGAEVSFSEQALYRDYLILLEKEKNNYNSLPLIFIVLKKNLDEINGKEDNIVTLIRQFTNELTNYISNEYFDAVKIWNIDKLIDTHIGNLKPLVGLNNISTQVIIMELLDEISSNPTLGVYESEKVLRIRDYNPGQYITRGVEDYARKLFISKYKGRGKIVFLFKERQKDYIRVAIKSKRREEFKYLIPSNSCVPSLRSPAGVKHIDVTGEEEYAIIDISHVDTEILHRAGLIEPKQITSACSDIKAAYNDLAGNILIVRRAQLTSPNIHYLAFFSRNKIIGPSAPMICINTEGLTLEDSKLLTLYLNSSITLLQLLAFAIETRGAWVALQGKQVWAHVHLPQFSDLSKKVKSKALSLFEQIGKIDVPSIYNRIKHKENVQRQIDEITLRMLGLDNWIGKLNIIYDSIAYELEIMDKILQISRSGRVSKKHKRKTNFDRAKQKRLDEYFE